MGEMVGPPDRALVQGLDPFVGKVRAELALVTVNVYSETTPPATVPDQARQRLDHEHRRHRSEAAGEKT